mmetsp:Transcript_90797/g.287688  ORF Transcript_90797/g.287688 Transcript_90797/m.287688 type:complete len:253 (+) Transcript_90797:2226-2984(+)
MRRAWKPLLSHASMRSCSSSLSSIASRGSSSSTSMPYSMQRRFSSSWGRDSQRVIFLQSSWSSGSSMPVSRGQRISSTYHSMRSSLVIFPISLSCSKSTSAVSPSWKRTGGMPCASHSRVTWRRSSRRTMTALRAAVKGTSYFRQSSRNSSSGRSSSTRASRSRSTRVWASAAASRGSPKRRCSARREARLMFCRRSSRARAMSASWGPRRSTGMPRACQRSARPRDSARRSRRQPCSSTSHPAAGGSVGRP